MSGNPHLNVVRLLLLGLNICLFILIPLVLPKDLGWRGAVVAWCFLASVASSYAAGAVSQHIAHMSRKE